MALSQWNLPFQIHNSQRDYPFALGVTKTDQTGTFTIPDEWLIYLRLPIHAAMDMEPSQFYVRQVYASATGYSLMVAYRDAAGLYDVASAMIPREGHWRGKEYSLGGIEPFTDTRGQVMIGRTEAIDAQPPGLWTFDFEATQLDSDAISPEIRGVVGLTVVNGNERSERLYGDIELVAGRNMQITPVLVAGQDPRLVFSAISGQGTIEDCICEGELAEKPCIRSINGIPPTPDGRFFLAGDECLELIMTENGIKIIDNCCLPCCGCPELEAITRDLQRFNTQRATLDNFANELLTSVTGMQLTVLGSRLGDRGCDPC